MRSAEGLTVLELLAAIAIAALLAGIGFPAFGEFASTSRMTARVNAFVHAIHRGKQAAHTTGLEVVLCKKHRTGTGCAHGARWQDGWLLFVNADGDYPPAVDSGETVLLRGEPWRRGRMLANRRLFVFRPFEIRSTNGSVWFCDERGSRAARKVVISYTGRPRLASRAELDRMPGCTG